MEEKTHWKKMKDPKFLGEWSLPYGRDVVLTLKTVHKDEAFNVQKQAKESVVVVDFYETYDWVKPLIANSTNLKAIQACTGSKFIEDWDGKKIKIGISPVKAFGTVTDALRVRNVSSAELATKYNAMQSDIDASKTQDELRKILIEKYIEFSPFDEATKKKINDKWKK